MAGDNDDKDNEPNPEPPTEGVGTGAGAGDAPGNGVLRDFAQTCNQHKGLRILSKTCNGPGKFVFP